MGLYISLKITSKKKKIYTIVNNKIYSKYLYRKIEAPLSFQ